MVIGRSRTLEVCLNSKTDCVSNGSFLSSGCNTPEIRKYDKDQVLKILQVKVMLPVELVMGQRREKESKAVFSFVWLTEINHRKDKVNSSYSYAPQWGQFVNLLFI